MTLHAAAKRLAHELHPITNAQHGNAEVEQSGVALRGAVSIHAGRPAGKDDAAWGEFTHASRRNVVPHNFAVHMLLAHPAGDELGVLRAEVENEDALGSDAWASGLGGFL